MSDFLFVVKCLLATLVLLVFMQLRVGHRTLEQHSVHWIQRSSAVEELRLVAEGAVRSVKAGYRSASGYFGENTIEIGQDDSWFKIKRSEAYQEQKAREEREARSLSSEEAETDGY